MSFDRALQVVLGYEGGYSNHPEDPGGATNLGITQRTLDGARVAHSGWGLPSDVRSLTRAQAARIYRAEYWDVVRGDDLPAPVALIVFDASVNHGPGRARKWLQESVGAATDGVLGPKTMAALAEASPLVVVREFALLRMMGYLSTGKMSTFGKGWTRRLMAVVIEATRLAR